MITRPDYQQAVSYALTRLKNELPLNLTYHNYWHSHSDVLPSVIRLARLNHLSEDELGLLEVGAAFHDIGFIITCIDHEKLGVEITKQALPDYGFQPEQIEQISAMIMATRLPQSPKNFIEQILADADLDVLGREDFFDRSEHLRLEQASLGEPFTVLQWYEIQMNFLKNHTYFTSQEKDLRQPEKLRHINILEEFLRIGRNGGGE